MTKLKDIIIMVSLSRLGASLVCRSDGACSVQCAFSLLFAYITISMIHKTFLLIQMNDSISELSSYLEKFLSTDYLPHVDFPRVNCCGSSKSLYCTECLKLLIDPSYWPESILKGELKLPFDLDIILYDNRRQCSSIHAMVLLNESLKHSSTSVHDNPIDNSSPLQTSSGSKMIHLIDIQRGDLVPSYYDNNTDDSSTCTYLLFPSSDSVPLSSVANQVRKLIVLDCKWTKCNTLPKELQNLNKVHLDYTPKESFFWRWHNAGEGMLCTLEAIYFAAVQISTCQLQNLSLSFTMQNNDKLALLDIMWLFAIQRRLTCTTVEKHGRPLPFSTNGKELQRNYRINSK